MTKSDFKDTFIGVAGLLAALAALYFSLKPSTTTPSAPTNNETIIEPSQSGGASGVVGSGSPQLQTYTGQSIAHNPYGAAPAFPSDTLSPVESGQIIFPPLQDEGLTVPAEAPINNNISIGTCCG